MSGRGAPPALVLFNRDLRIRDHPALVAASAGDRRVLALFVLDETLLAAPTTGPNRLAFLLESIVELRAAMRCLGGELFVRRGDPAAVACTMARDIKAAEIHVSRDVTPRARIRVAALRRSAAGHSVSVHEHSGVAIVDPGALVPSGGGDHYKVFTPYFRAWSALPRRPVLDAPVQCLAPEDIDPGTLPDLSSLCAGRDPLATTTFAPRRLGAPSPRRDPGGESRAHLRLDAWLAAEGPTHYSEVANALGSNATSRLAAYLHFGCLSPVELEATVRAGRATPDDRASEGVEAFVRQLCWRDFYLSVANAFPSIGRADYRRRPIEWRRDDAELAAWKQGTTGVELVDAAMRQLLEEGFVHNRARLVASSYLTKTLRHDWREGAADYQYWLTDADVASNAGNWQWMAGTGNDTRPNRVLSPTRQAARFDPDGSYRRRYGALPIEATQGRFGDLLS